MRCFRSSERRDRESERSGADRVNADQINANQDAAAQDAAVHGKAEEGSAVIEFVFLAVMLMVPTIYALVAVSSAQSAAYASVAAGQQALQVIEERGLDEVSAPTAQAAAAFAAQDYGIPAEQVQTTLSCTGDCTGRDHLSIEVRVGVVPPLLGWIGEGKMMTMSTTLSSWGGRYE